MYLFLLNKKLLEITLKYFVPVKLSNILPANILCQIYVVPQNKRYLLKAQTFWKNFVRFQKIKIKKLLTMSKRK